MDKEKKSKLFDIITTIILLIIIIVLVAIIAQKYLSPSNQANERAPQRTTATEAINVEVLTATPSLFEQTTTIGAEVVDDGKTINLTSSLSGTLTELIIEKDMQVKEGDIIGYVDPSVPGAEYKEQPIYSKVSGLVTEVASYKGQEITTNTTLGSVKTKGKLTLEAQMPEKYLSSITVGMKGSFITSAWPDDKIEAVVSAISNSVNSSNRTFTMTLSFNSDEKIKEGMFVALTLVTNKIENAITIPTTALKSYLSEEVVYVAVDNVAERKVVSSGVQEKGNVVIASGLEENEIVIIKGNVTQGSLINIVE
ncbi:MAG: efflux RND transporter periplasmic adaptor subunit [Spirochaetales bacterium]|nr:efflux RND transporter periplasmic adaptor subunit [Spirochaetales bacterium]